MDDVNEFRVLMSKGTYESFSNIVYLGGACNVGKSTLASILTGRPIPWRWLSTNGLEIYFGHFGIDLERKEMIPVSKENREILTTILLGQPDLETSISSEDYFNVKSSDKVATSQTSPSDLKTSISSEANFSVISSDKVATSQMSPSDLETSISSEAYLNVVSSDKVATSQISPPDLETSMSSDANTIITSSNEATTNQMSLPDLETSKASDAYINKISPDEQTTKPERKSIPVVKKGLTESLQGTTVTPVLRDPKFKVVSAKTYATLHEELKRELKYGTYKIRVAPSDLIDFGGQRSFDMTHQLFIRQKGVFVMMIDGRKNLPDVLEEYIQGDVTTASNLTHWVNSIFTYCGVDDDDILPLIIFVATHSDSFPQGEEQRKVELTHQLTELFKEHEYRHKILYDSLYFINGTDISDEGIKNLKAKLVEVAFKQRSWGQKMPMAWVPLELQISEMRSDGINIISLEELSTLNEANGELALTAKQLEHFLKSQHSLGKIMYFDLPGLKSFVIIQPRALVDILRSVITDERFWPRNPTFNKILSNVKNSGHITKQDLFRLWSQDKFNCSLPTIEIKEFIAKVLAQLDILVEPKRYKAVERSITEFLVPCIVNRKVQHTTADIAFMEGRTLCLSYKLVKSYLPGALSYKLIGALLNIWPIKETHQGSCLFHKCAILSIDGTNELHVSMTDNQIMIYLINSESLYMISPDIASIVKEYVSIALEKVLEFYHTNSGNLSAFDPLHLYEIEVGEKCHGDDCLIPLSEAQSKNEWECKHNEKHKTKTCLNWIHKKENKECPPECEGLDEECLEYVPSDKHLVRLDCQVTQKFDEFVIHLGLEWNEWQEIVSQYSVSNIFIAKFKALCKCRLRKEEDLSELQLKDLSEALCNIGYSKHQLCKIFREDVKIHDIASVHLQIIPDDETLEELSKTIGNCATHLGVELELKLPIIENIIYQNSKDLFKQNLAILLEWKEVGQNKTIHFLMKALQRADARGLTFIRKKFK